MKYTTLFLILLLIGISPLAIAAEEVQCINCGGWDVPGQHDCPELKKKDKKIEELEKELDELKKQKEQESKQQDALGVLDLLKLPIKGVYGMGKTIYNGIKDAMGYMCDNCKTYQYGSHICTPTSCSVCGAIGSHQCPGPVINMDNEPLSIKKHTCPECGVTWSGSHTCIASESGSQ